VLNTDSLIRFADVVGRAAALLPGSGVEPKGALVMGTAIGVRAMSDDSLTSSRSQRRRVTSTSSMPT
jgi:hypothetical protein